MKKNNKLLFFRTSVIAVSVCICFFVCSQVYVFFVMSQNQKSSIGYLSELARQNRIAIESLVKGDIQTLEGIAACLKDKDIRNPEQIMKVLKEVKTGDSFLRMGLADTDGQVDMLDMKGGAYIRSDLSREEFFQNALKGEGNMSVSMKDSVSDGYVNYYGVSVKEEGQVIGVLCAVSSSELIRNIIDTPVFTGSGYSNIIDSKGNFIIRSGQSAAILENTVNIREIGQINDDVLFKITDDLAAGRRGSFTYMLGGKKQLAVYEPIDLNGWYVLSTVSRSAAMKYYDKTLIGTTMIIVAACLIFLILLYKQKRMMNKNRDNLLELAYKDPLTGCRNFNRFLLDAGELVQNPSNVRYAAWYLDLKKFKYINDIYGYDAGDEILKQISRLLEESSLNQDLFCRVSADNFAGMRTYNKRQDLVRWFSKLRDELNRSARIMSSRIQLELYMGFYCIEEQDRTMTVNDMVNRAIMALKTVKYMNGKQYMFFTNEIREQILKESELEAMEQESLDKGEFCLYLQPKVDIQSSFRITGAEVLARWKHPERGMISPGDFIPLFEKNGFIVRLDRYMFEEVCKWLKGYLEAGRPAISIAVNVSRLGLLQEDFIRYYSNIKEKYGIPDRILELEFTESLVLDDDVLFQETVKRLQDKGFICSMDDFGAGYSSLNILKNLSIDVLKLDILFFKECRDIRRERVVITHIIAMAKDLGIKTIAEGVETQDQVEFLKEVGCDIVQGYIFSKPMPLDEFDERLLTLGEGLVIKKVGFQQ